MINQLYVRILNNQRIIVRHPKWYSSHPTNDGNLLTNEELLEHNFFPIVTEYPEYNSETQRIVENDVSDWILGETSISKTFTIIDYSEEELEEIATIKQNSFNNSVDTERDRRIELGVTFNSILFQSRGQDRENISGASIMALAAMMQGAQPGDYYWHGGSQPFVWIAADNSTHQMDAQTVFAFGQAMAAHKSTLIFTARYIKDNVPIGTDITSDELWNVT